MPQILVAEFARDSFLLEKIGTMINLRLKQFDDGSPICIPLKDKFSIVKDVSNSLICRSDEAHMHSILKDLGAWQMSCTRMPMMCMAILCVDASQTPLRHWCFMHTWRTRKTLNMRLNWNEGAWASCATQSIIRLRSGCCHLGILALLHGYAVRYPHFCSISSHKSSQRLSTQGKTLTRYAKGLPARSSTHSLYQRPGLPSPVTIWCHM